MSYIEELRQRVESAERRFGLIDEQERRYSERLISLMDALEAEHEARQAADVAHAGRIGELERENGELRGMLHALLLGVEAGSRDTLAGTLRDLDTRLSGMVRPADGTDSAESPVADDGAVAVETDEAAEAIAADAEGFEDVTPEEIAAEELVAEGAVGDEIVMDEALEIVEEDAVAAAEQAVADLLRAGAEGGAQAPVVEDVALEVATDDAAEEFGIDIGMDEFAPDASGDEPAGSPVAEMMDRLADETQDFAAEEPVEAEPELALDEMPTADAAAAAKPARKKA